MSTLINVGATLPKPVVDPKDDHIQDLEEDLSKIRSHITCVVCQDLLFEPFTLECGHTFCYNCLLDWLKHKKTCPECRSNVTRIPTPSFIIKDIGDTYVARIELQNPHGEGSELRKAQRQSAEAVERDKKNADKATGGLFQGLFSKPPLRHAIHDEGDRVDRCPYCTWEIENGRCTQCFRRFAEDGHELSDDDSDNDFYDDDELDEFDDFYDLNVLVEEDEDMDDNDTDRTGFGPVIARARAGVIPRRRRVEGGMSRNSSVEPWDIASVLEDGDEDDEEEEEEEGEETDDMDSVHNFIVRDDEESSSSNHHNRRVNQYLQSEQRRTHSQRTRVSTTDEEEDEEDTDNDLYSRPLPFTGGSLGRAPPRRRAAHIVISSDNEDEDTDDTAGNAGHQRKREGYRPLRDAQTEEDGHESNESTGTAASTQRSRRQDLTARRNRRVIEEEEDEADDSMDMDDDDDIAPPNARARVVVNGSRNARQPRTRPISRQNTIRTRRGGRRSEPIELFSDDDSDDNMTGTERGSRRRRPNQSVQPEINSELRSVLTSFGQRRSELAFAQLDQGSVSPPRNQDQPVPNNGSIVEFSSTPNPQTPSHHSSQEPSISSPSAQLRSTAITRAFAGNLEQRQLSPTSVRSQTVPATSSSIPPTPATGISNDVIIPRREEPCSSPSGNRVPQVISPSGTSAASSASFRTPSPEISRRNTASTSSNTNVVNTRALNGNYPGLVDASAAASRRLNTRASRSRLPENQPPGLRERSSRNVLRSQGSRAHIRTSTMNTTTSPPPGERSLVSPTSPRQQYLSPAATFPVANPSAAAVQRLSSYNNLTERQRRQVTEYRQAREAELHSRIQSSSIENVIQQQRQRSLAARSGSETPSTGISTMNLPPPVIAAAQNPTRNGITSSSDAARHVMRRPTSRRNVAVDSAGISRRGGRSGFNIGGHGPGGPMWVLPAND